MQRIMYLSRGGNIGGSQRQLYHVIKNLDRSRFEPVVVCKKDGESADQLRSAQIPTHITPMRPWRSFPIGIMRYPDAHRLTDFARQKNVSLIHSTDLWLSPYLEYSARRTNVPSILHVRTPLKPERIYKYRGNHVDSIIAISRRTKNNLLSVGIQQEKITVINDAVDTEAFEPAKSRVKILKKQFQNATGILIGIVGRIDSFKRQLDFLKAAKDILHKHKRNATFFIVGDVHDQTYYEKVLTFIQQNNLQKNVILTGQRNDMPQVLGSLDILISLSGGSIMFEAMSAAKPVISAGFTTKQNSVHLQDNKTGILIPSKSNDKLVNAAIRLIDSPDLRRYLGKEALKWAHDNFSHASLAIKTQNLYERVLAQYKQKDQLVATPVPQPIPTRQSI